MQSSTIALQMNDHEDKLNSDAMLSEDFPDATFTNTLHSCRTILDEGFVDFANFQIVPPAVPTVKVERQRQSCLKGENGSGSSLKKSSLKKPSISPSPLASEESLSRPVVHSSLPEESMVSFINDFNPFQSEEEPPSRGSSLNDISKSLPETRNTKEVKRHPRQKNDSTRSTTTPRVGGRIPSHARKEKSNKSNSQRKSSRSPNGMRATEAKAKVTTSRSSDSASEGKRLSKSRSPKRNANETMKTSANKMKERRETTNDPDQSGEDGFTVIKSRVQKESTSSSKSDLDQNNNDGHSGNLSEKPGSEQSVAKMIISADESEVEGKDPRSATSSEFPNAIETDDDCWMDVPKSSSLDAADPVWVQPKEETDSVETKSSSLGTKETRSSSRSRETRSSSRSRETRSSSRSRETRSSSKSSTRRKYPRSSSDRNLQRSFSVNRGLSARSTSLRDLGQPYDSTLSSSFSSFQRQLRKKPTGRDPHPNHVRASQHKPKESSPTSSRSRGVPRSRTFGNDSQSLLSALTRTRSLRDVSRGTSKLSSSSSSTGSPAENRPTTTRGASFRVPRRNRSTTQLSVFKNSIQEEPKQNTGRNLPRHNSCSKLRLHNEQLKQRLTEEVSNSITERNHKHHHHSIRHVHGHSSKLNNTSEADDRHGRATRGGGAASRLRSSSADAAKNYRKRCSASAASRRSLAKAKDKKVAEPDI